MDDIKNKRGGWRNGAGRKKTSVKVVAFRAPQDIIDILANTDNMTAFICEAIRTFSKQLHYEQER